ncbi:MAG: hypothetical protein Q7S40_15715 [Opitutaceae bacterium]|nr:hypothetical protein [Opitutaceae bacterium]
MPAQVPSRIVAGISFVGRGGGAVKTLAGFKKGHHSVPDAANATTNAFLGKLCASELADDAEKLFQDVRTALGYKRKDISLSVASPAATLMAKDFVVELSYALEARDPRRYIVTTTLHQLASHDLAQTEKFSRVFAARFTEISFALKKAARVEAIIDAIEALDGEDGLGVTYPSDYAQCLIRVDGIDAEVRCTGAALDMVFRRAAAPAELIDAFAEVREAFQISKPLAGLID